MARKPEGRFQDRFTAMLRGVQATGVPLWYMVTVQTGYTQAGIHDVFITMGGLMISAELKVGRNKPTKAQYKFRDDAINAGWGASLIVNDSNYPTFKSRFEALAGLYEKGDDRFWLVRKFFTLHPSEAIDPQDYFGSEFL